MAGILDQYRAKFRQTYGLSGSELERGRVGAMSAPRQVDPSAIEDYVRMAPVPIGDSSAAGLGSRWAPTGGWNQNFERGLNQAHAYSQARGAGIGHAQNPGAYASSWTMRDRLAGVPMQQQAAPAMEAPVSMPVVGRQVMPQVDPRILAENRQATMARHNAQQQASHDYRVGVAKQRAGARRQRIATREAMRNMPQGFDPMLAAFGNNPELAVRLMDIQSRNQIAMAGLMDNRDARMMAREEKTADRKADRELFELNMAGQERLLGRKLTAEEQAQERQIAAIQKNMAAEFQNQEALQGARLTAEEKRAQAREKFESGQQEKALAAQERIASENIKSQESRFSRQLTADEKANERQIAAAQARMEAEFAHAEKMTGMKLTSDEKRQMAQEKLARDLQTSELAARDRQSNAEIAARSSDLERRIAFDREMQGDELALRDRELQMRQLQADKELAARRREFDAETGLRAQDLDLRRSSVQSDIAANQAQIANMAASQDLERQRLAMQGRVATSEAELNAARADAERASAEDMRKNGGPVGAANKRSFQEYLSQDPTLSNPATKEAAKSAGEDVFAMQKQSGDAQAGQFMVMFDESPTEAVKAVESLYRGVNPDQAMDLYARGVTLDVLRRQMMEMRRQPYSMTSFGLRAMLGMGSGLEERISKMNEISRLARRMPGWNDSMADEFPLNGASLAPSSVSGQRMAPSAFSRRLASPTYRPQF